MRAAHARDDAKTAWMIAAFRDFQICEVARGQAKARRDVIRDVLRARRDVEQRRGDGGGRSSSGYYLARFTKLICSAKTFVSVGGRGARRAQFGKLGHDLFA